MMNMIFPVAAADGTTDSASAGQLSSTSAPVTASVPGTDEQPHQQNYLTPESETSPAVASPSVITDISDSQHPLSPRTPQAPPQAVFEHQSGEEETTTTSTILINNNSDLNIITEATTSRPISSRLSLQQSPSPGASVKEETELDNCSMSSSTSSVTSTHLPAENGFSGLIPASNAGVIGNNLMINGLVCANNQQPYGYSGHSDQHSAAMATIIDQYQQQKRDSADSRRSSLAEHKAESTTSSQPQSPLDDNNNANGLNTHLKSPSESLLGSANPSPSPSPTAAIVIQNQAQYKQTLEYLKQLFSDRENLRLIPYGVFAHIGRLLEQEIQRVRASLIHIDGAADQRSALVLPEPEGETVTRSRKIYVPVEKYPDYNFIGRIIGPRGLTIRELEVDCGCKLYIRGRGSLRDRNKEEKLKSQSNWEHLNDELHVLITVEDTENRVNIKLERAVSEINKLLDSVISNKDEFKMRQLAELAILNDKFKSQTNAAMAAAAAAAVQASVGSPGVADAAQQAATLQILSNVSSGQTGVSQVSPINATGTSISHAHHAALAGHHQQMTNQHAAAVAAVHAAAQHHQHQAATAAAVAALQAANHQHQAAAFAQQHHPQIHHSVASALASQQATQNAYQLQAAAAAAANHQRSFGALYAPQAAFAPAGLETAHGLLFNAPGLVPQASLLQDAITPLTAVQFPVANGGQNKRYHPYNKKKN